MVVAYITDLFFQAKVGETAKQTGVELSIVNSVYKLFPLLNKNPSLVIIDLKAEGISGPALISQIKGSNAGTPVVAFAPHVEKTLFQHAEQAGADKVMPRSVFSESLPEILREFTSPDTDAE